MATDTHHLDLNQDLELRLAEVGGRLSPNDKRIAALLRDHAQELAFHTAESLAQGAGVSAAAVVRFARRLGYSSFRDLRDRARAELWSDQQQPPPAARATDTLSRKTERDISSLRLLPHLLGDTIADAAKTISEAEHTWFLGNREVYGLVAYAYRLLHHARTRVGLIDPSFPDACRDLGPGDVLLACTFRPYARETLNLLPEARSAGAELILLTDGLAHDFIEPTDTVLAVPVDSPTIFLSFTPALCVLETLAALVARLDPDRTYDTLEATSKFVDRQQLERDPHERDPRRSARRRRERSSP
ncbi:MAG TPA: MurR/RpiR family transcriptional regulator [Solirubrobacteraceae bacterium]|nr:MurR/RpiR family transcriptional regulator [Solirubrobacteraceae bacterium]